MKKIIALALLVVSLLSISIPAFAGELTVGSGGSDKFLYDISGRTTAPSFSVRPINTAANHTANVKLNFNDLTVAANYFKVSNTIGLSGSTTEKILRESSTFRFVPGRSDKAQIELISTNGSFSIRFSMI